MPSAATSPRLILANTVNELMLAIPVSAHSMSLFASTSRKCWLAESGDFLVLPRLPSDAFLSYVCRILGLDQGKIQITTTNSAPTGLLGHDIIACREILDRLSRFCLETQGGVELLCYALDAPTFELMRVLDINPVYYCKRPPLETLKTIYSLNTKSGFRHFAKQAGISIPDGIACSDVAELHTAVADLLTQYPRVRIKPDRSSNCYGQATATVADGTITTDETICRVLLTCNGQPSEYVVECELDVVASPSLELNVKSEGVLTSYFCLQRYRHGHFSGMLADQNSISPSIRAIMSDAGHLLGEYLHAQGYRGVFDIDAAVTSSGQLYFTETNVRRTAGTFIHDLVSRLSTKSSIDDLVWIADSLDAPTTLRFDAGCAAIARSGLEYDPITREGVLLTSDSIEVDGIWRYLVLAKDREQAEQLEQALLDVLSVIGEEPETLMHTHLPVL